MGVCLVCVCFGFTLFLMLHLKWHFDLSINCRSGLARSSDVSKHSIPLDQGSLRAHNVAEEVWNSNASYSHTNTESQPVTSVS